jgi:transcriptional regulator with AAA-type ATPase domain
MAHHGTLFLDEIRHLQGALQASLLGVLNNHRYRPKMADYEVQSLFDLVVATNDPQWRDRLADDFRDRIERIVLEVPPFRVLQRADLADLWCFWECTLRRRCRECGVDYTEPTPECRAELEGVFRHQPLAGNWRDLMRLADQVLLLLTAARGGRATPLTWNRELLEQAVFRTFHGVYGSQRTQP